MYHDQLISQIYYFNGVLHPIIYLDGKCFFDGATFNNISVISWRSVLLVKDTGVPGENHRPAASH